MEETGKEMNYENNLKGRSAEGEKVIPVIEENLQVEKKVVEEKKLQLTKKVNTEEVTVNIPVIVEKVRVERVPVNKPVDSAPETRQEGDTTIIPVVKEVLVVEKRLMLVEEIHITKERTETESSQKEVIRKEEIVINEKDSNDYPKER